MYSYGKAVRISIFGTSRGAALGCVVDGLPAGFEPDLAAIRRELQLRRPRSSAESTSRSESDSFEIVSGLYQGRLSGDPLTVLFRNEDGASGGERDTSIPRPSHADLAAHIKFGGFSDPRGGGAFSGRLTLPLVFVGALVRELLLDAGIEIRSHIMSIGSLLDEGFDPMMTAFPTLDPYFPLIDASLKPRMERLLASVREAGDSIGATLECAALGVPAGIGEPFFDSIESEIAHLMLAVPGVHGIEFGAGFELSRMRASEANDPILPDLRTASNNSGGVNGGIANGMPIIFRAAFRPVPSVSLVQSSVSLNTCEAAELIISGRHDACILPRGCIISEAVTAIALYELLQRGRAHAPRQAKPQPPYAYDHGSKK